MKHRLIAAVGLCCAVAPFAARADSCDAVRAATRAELQTPRRQSFTLTVLGKVTGASEVIFTGSAMYARDNGGDWEQREYEPEKLLTKSLAVLVGAHCQKVREENVNGIATVYYTAIQKKDGKDAYSGVWVSRRDGRVVKKTYGGKNVKAEWSVRYDGSIEPPEGFR
jgi:hypothetical protein